MIAAVGSGCALGIGGVAACAALLLPVTMWPAYVLGLLRLPEDTVARIERAVVRTTVALVVAATACILFLAVHGC
jgi:hypothetical protein